MVSIAVVQQANNYKLGLPSLQSAALWYQGIPEPHLCLNDHAYLLPEAHTTATYWPFFWAKFGGPGGVYLRHLTGITVHSNITITEIRFQYDIDDIPSNCRRLGRHSCLVSGCYRPMNFTIDGPGGERITGIELGCVIVPLDKKSYSYPFGQDSLDSLTVRHTDRTFEPEPCIHVRFGMGELISFGTYRFSRILGDHSRARSKSMTHSRIQKTRNGSGE